MVVRYKTIPAIVNEFDRFFALPQPLSPRIRFIESNRGIEVHETADGMLIDVELPGVSKDDVKITLHENVLTVTAERKKPVLNDSDQWIRNEISYGIIEHTVNVPYAIESKNIAATHENGLLRINLPKAESAKPKQISIR